MSIEDEIRAKKEKMQADMRETERKKQEAERLALAMREARMHEGSPVLIMPPSELQTAISETMPSMKFSNRKFMKTMPKPNGRTYVRRANMGQNGDSEYWSAFDVQLFSSGTGKNAWAYEMWVFSNGAVAFCKVAGTSETNMTWDELKSHGIDSSIVRSKIIEALAQQAIQAEQKAKEGCYIATAVYGSYDCPEVWVLRRFRDDVLLSNCFGRLFVKVYYAISPTLVKVMGGNRWFVSFWRRFLDRTISALKTKGFSDQKYNDRI